MLQSCIQSSSSIILWLLLLHVTIEKIVNVHEKFLKSLVFTENFLIFVLGLRCVVDCAGCNMSEGWLKLGAAFKLNLFETCVRHPQDPELDYQRVGDIAAGGPEQWNKNIQAHLDKNFQIVRHQDSIPLVPVSPVLWLDTQNNCFLLYSIHWKRRWTMKIFWHFAMKTKTCQ